MILVNQKFKDSCNNANVQSQFKLYLSENKNSNVLATLNDDEFIIDSGSIEKQASSGAVLNIGGVCSNRIKITLTQKGVEKVNNVNGFKKNYALHLVQWNRVDDANQSPSDFSKNLDDSENITGKCDLGFYYISEIDNNYYNCVITCYDGMIAFQRNFTITQIKYLKNNSKTVDGWLSYFCSLVNDSNFLISYTDNTEVTCNDGVSFSLSDDVDFDTMREAISQLAMLKMAYATIDSLGNLTLKPAIKTNTSTYDDTVANQYMFSCDNEVKESVIKYFYTSVAGFEYENTYQDQEGRNEINIYLEENKFLRGFEPYNGSAMSSSSLTCLRNMAQAVMGYSFYSCDCEVNERPYIELGDNVQVQRRLVDTEGTVTQISIPVVVDNLSHSLGSTTHLSSNSTVSTNSSSSGKMNLNGGGNVNSKIKEPSANDVYNTITDETTSPVTKYTDTTATVRIRVDSNNTGNFDIKDAYDDLNRNYTPTYITEGSEGANLRYLVNNLTQADKIFVKNEIAEKTKGKYIYDSRLNINDYDNFKVKYKVIAGYKKSILDAIIGLTIPTTLDSQLNLKTGTITGYVAPILSLKRAAISIDDINNIQRRTNTGTPATGIPQASFPYDIRNNSSTSSVRYRMSLDVFRDMSLNNLVDNEQGSYIYEVNSADAVSKADVINSLKQTLTGMTVYNKIDASSSAYVNSDIDTEENAVATYIKRINPYINNWQEILKYLIIGVNISIKYKESGDDTEYTTTLAQFVLNWSKNMIGTGTTATETRYRAVADLFNPYVSTILKIFDTVSRAYTSKIKDFYIESTYATHTVQISDADKTAADEGLATESLGEDLSYLENRVSKNEQDISTLKGNITSLNSSINDVNNDLQDTKQDIATNTQKIATNTGNIAALDDRVDALEDNVVEANPSDAATATLTKIKVNDVVYDVPSGGGGGGTTVIANPSGQAAADLEKLQVGNIIYAIPSGGGGASHDELIVTSEHNITLLGNGRTLMNYDKILYQEGNSFINYDVTTGFWTVSEDTLMSVEIQSNLESYGNAWLTYRIFEANTANINDTTGTQGQIYYCYTFGFTEFPIIKCRPNYYYFVAAYKANSGNWTMTKSENDSTTGLYQMKNFAKFVKKNGVYTPT